MRLNIIVCAMALTTSSVIAQSYTFEENYKGWESKNGDLSLSTEHAKEGGQSLRWSSQGVSQLEISGFNIATTANNSANMQIYSPERTNDTMVVEFIKGDRVEKRGHYLFNYKGWHEFKRWYQHYENSANTSFDKVRFTLKPTSDTPRSIYFDDVELDRPIDRKKDLVGAQWILDVEVLKFANISALGGYSVTKEDPFLFATSPRDIPITKPTAEELKALHKIRNLFKPSASFNVKAYNAAVEYVDGLNLAYNADGTPAAGDVIAAGSSDISIKTYIAAPEDGGVLSHLVALAGGVTDGAIGASDRFNQLFDYVIDQGLGYGAPIHARSNAYSNIRGMLSTWLSIVAGCTDDTRYEEALHALRWFSYYGAIFIPEEDVEFCISSDVMYLASRAILSTIACDNDDESAVRDLKAYKRYLERSLSYTPGMNDMLKPDGTGFHHGVHYINYMRAYTTITDACGWLSGTPFRVSPEAYEHLRCAVITVYTMATTGKNNANMYALSHAGRHPFGGNHQVSYRRSNFETLIEVGRDCLGVESEPIAEGAYNYFFESSKYKVAATPYEGFYAFNYDPSGIYRQDNWVVTMRAPTYAFFGSELYVRTNRFGRYQANGTLDVVYNGKDLSESGYLTDPKGGGWDWNSPSGGTTVHFTNWRDLMPGGDLTTRHDQHADDTNFSGGLSFGNSGIYGAEYRQRESWSPGGRSNFPGFETHLSFKKSYYCFDGIIIALGSDISTSGDYPNDMLTATTLFQEIIKDPNRSNLNINGKDRVRGYSEELNSSNNESWIITPHGTGYFIPKGANDNLVISYQDQTTPQHSGVDVESPKTTVTAVKAHFAHGYKTTDSKYCYIMRPASTKKDMEALAKEAKSGKLYKIERQDGAMHSLYYYPTSTRSYSIFEALSDIKDGVVESVSSPHLLMVREGEDGAHHFAAADPNLHPIPDRRKGINHEVLFNPSSTTITLRGEYYIAEAVEGVEFSTPKGGKTEVTIQFQDGVARYFSAIKK